MCFFFFILFYFILFFFDSFEPSLLFGHFQCLTCLSIVEIFFGRCLIYFWHYVIIFLIFCYMLQFFATCQVFSQKCWQNNFDLTVFSFCKCGQNDVQILRFVTNLVLIYETNLVLNFATNFELKFITIRTKSK